MLRARTVVNPDLKLKTRYFLRLLGFWFLLPECCVLGWLLLWRRGCLCVCVFVTLMY